METIYDFSQKDTSFEISKWIPDPEMPGTNYIVFDRNCSVKELIVGLTEYLSSVKLHLHGGDSQETVYDLLDYISGTVNLIFYQDIPEFRFIYCYIVEGGSEGYYFHISVAVKTPIPDHPDPNYNGLSEQRLITGKTLMGLQEALLINHYINSFLIQSS